MKVPLTAKLVVLTLGATAFYTWVGQLVPQKEVHPPEVTEIAEDVSTEEMVEIGQEIFNGKGICATCHTIGQSGGALRFPDLGGIATRAADRVPELGQVEYLAQSLYEPEAFIVPGFNPGMPRADEPPVALSNDEIKAVIAYLQTLGGEATVTMATRLPYAEGADPTSDVDPAGGGEVAVADEGEDAEQPVGPEADAPPVPGGGAEALLAQYNCSGCHAAGGEAAALTDIGSRLARDEIVAGLVAHPPMEGGFEARATLAEIRGLADHLAAGGGGGGGGAP